MKKRSKPDYLVISLIAIIVVGALCAVLALIPFGKDSTPSENETLVTDHSWQLPQMCSVVKGADGKEKVIMTSSTSAVAWNTAHPLEGAWSVSARIELRKRTGESDCARIVFGDEFGNIGLVASVEYRANGTVQLRMDMMRYLGWRELYTTEQWVGADLDKPLDIGICLDPDQRTLTVTLSQDGTVLSEVVTEKVPERVLETLKRAGVGVYDSDAGFSDFQAGRA